MGKNMVEIVRKAVEGDREALDVLIQEKMKDVLYITYLFAEKDYEDV